MTATHEAATIEAAALRTFTLACFRSAGFHEDAAARATDVLIWASLRGVDTHGIRNLKGYYIDSTGGVGRRDGVVLPDAQPEVERESAATAAWNAHGALGLAVSCQAMESAIAKAAELGVGVVTVRNSTHFGPAGYYAHLAVPHDMIGLASTGYVFPLGQDKAVVPFGGLLPMLSTNPIALACPAGAHPPFVLDMSTSVVPVNRVEMLEELEQPIPSGWALDAEHQPTDAPADVRKMVPLGGATELGGHKGYGLAVASWILTGLLSGAWRRDPQMDRVLGDQRGTCEGFAQEGIGHCFAAIRIDQFADPEQFKQGLASMLSAFQNSPPAPGVPRVLTPGQLEAETQVQRERDGIPLSPRTVTSLQSLAERFNLPLPIRQ